MDDRGWSHRRVIDQPDFVRLSISDGRDSLIIDLGRDRLLDWAAEDDTGFDRQIFARMLTTIDRVAELDLPVGRRKAVAVRAYIHDWAAELEPSLAASPGPDRGKPDISGREAEPS